MIGKIIINGRFEGRRITGVDRYASEILRRLGDRVEVIKPRRSLAGLSGHLWEQFVLPLSISGRDLIWSPANSGPIAVSRQVLTIHDLSPLEHPEWFTPAYSIWYRWLYPILARRVKCVLTPSLYVQQKVIHRFSLAAGRVPAVPEGVDPEMFHPTNSSSIQRHFLLPDRYVLFIGSLQPRKNLGILLEAWRRLKVEVPNVSLVVAGTTGHVFRRIELPAGMERVTFLGYVPEEDLPALYSGAEIFVLPSLDEGFGLTVLEAMACGTPVIISKAGALPEVAGEAAIQVDPYSINELTAAIKSLLSSEDLRSELREKGLDRARQFTWEQSAEQVWEVLSSHV